MATECSICGRRAESLISFPSGTKLCGLCSKAHGLFPPVPVPNESSVEVPDFILVDEVTGKFNRQTPEYIVSLSDQELSKIQFDRKSKFKSLGWPLTVCRVSAGFTVKHHAAAYGSCLDDFNYIQTMDFDDKPTDNAIVYCTIFQKGFNKSAGDQIRALQETATRLKMPPWHLQSFGSASLVALLLLHYRKETNQPMLPHNSVVRTDAMQDGGKWRISFNQDSSYGLKCQNGLKDSLESNSMGCFAIGVDLI